MIDLGPDGLGFIAEDNGRIWAFRQRDLERRLVESELSFPALEGSKVRFSIIENKVRRVDLYPHVSV